MADRIVIVGGQGFWGAREVVRSLLPPDIELHFSMELEIEEKRRGQVCALVVADQKIDGELMDKYPNLRTVARTGTGYDAIDTAAAKKRGIVVTRVAKLNAEAVAEFVLAHIFAFAKNIHVHHRNMMRSDWNRIASRRIADLTVGIVGLGTVGRELARKLHLLGVKKLIGWNRTMRPEVRVLAESTEIEVGTDANSLSALCEKSDVVVLAVALTRDTHRLISALHLSLMKPRTFLINVCRGAVVDEVYLARRIEEGMFAGVALDVFSVEPPEGNLFETAYMRSLRESSRVGETVILSPHLAGKTERSDLLISQEVARNIAGVLKGDLSLVEVVPE